MRILHVSDLHVPAPLRALRIADVFSPKRLLGLANLRLRRGRDFACAHALLERLTTWAATSLRPDVVVFSGDVASIGSPGELSYLRNIIQPLTTVAPVFACVPGNHDVYSSNVPYARFFGDLCPRVADAASWPRMIKLDSAVLILMNSARPRQLPISGGRLSMEQIERMAGMLDETDTAACMRLVVLHHAPRRADGRCDARLHGLFDRAAFEARLAGRRKVAVLHGHLHHTYCVRLPGMPPTFCAGSATLSTRAGCWVFDLGPGRFQATPGQFRDGAWDLNTANGVMG